MGLLDGYKNMLQDYKTKVVDEVREKVLGEGGNDENITDNKVIFDNEIIYIEYIIENSSESMDSLSKKFNLDIGELKHLNKNINLNKNSVVKIPAVYYVVSSGKGLISIMRDNNINIDENSPQRLLFLEGNKLSIKSNISPNQQLKVIKQKYFDKDGYYYYSEGTLAKSSSINKNIPVDKQNGRVHIAMINSDGSYYFNPIKHPFTNRYLSHSEFIQTCAFVYNEEDDTIAQKGIVHVMLNRFKKKSYRIDTLNYDSIVGVLNKAAGSGRGISHQSRMNSENDPAKIFRRYRIFINDNIDRDNEEKKDNLFPKKTAIVAVIDRFTNFNQDLVNSALFWHGKDFFYQYRVIDGVEIENKAYKKEYILKGFIWDKRPNSQDFFKGYYNPTDHPEFTKSSSLLANKYQYIGVASLGKTIFMIFDENVVFQLKPLIKKD